MGTKTFPIPAQDDIETIFAHVQCRIDPREFGRGEMLFLIVQNPLLNPDGTTSNAMIWVGSASNMIYLILPGQESPPIYAEDLKDLYMRLNFPAVNPNGEILTVAIGAHGSGYTVGDVLTLTPDFGSFATVTVATLDGFITAAVLNAGGAGYLAGDVLSVTGGDGLGRITVDTVDGGGAVLTFHVSTAGSGYTSTVANATAGGTGAGATFNTTASRGVATLAITTPGNGFSALTLYPVVGGTGVGATVAVLTVTAVAQETADVALFIYRKRKGGYQ